MTSPQPRVTAREAFWIVGAPRERRLMIEAALERLDGLRERLIDRLDALDGDPDLEPSLGATEAMNHDVAWSIFDPGDFENQSEDEGFDSDSEPDSDAEPDGGDWCNWQDEGDQTVLASLRSFRFSPKEIERARDRCAPLLALGGKAVRPQSVKRLLTKRRWSVV